MTGVVASGILLIVAVSTLWWARRVGFMSPEFFTGAAEPISGERKRQLLAHNRRDDL